MEGTKWELRETYDLGSDMIVTSVMTWEFKEDNVFVETWDFEFSDTMKDLYDEVVLDSLYESYSWTGTWSVDGDELTISEYGTATAEIDGDTLSVGGLKLTRVK